MEGGASREAPPLGAAWLVRASSGAGSGLEWILAFLQLEKGPMSQRSRWTVIGPWWLLLVTGCTAEFLVRL